MSVPITELQSSPGDLSHALQNESPKILIGRLRHYIGKAIARYQLINDGDSILVGVSGGKDSMLLIKFLAELKNRAPVRYRLGAAHLGPMDEPEPQKSLDALNLDFVHYEQAPKVPELEKYRQGVPSPCFACARARRNRLFEIARKYNVNSLAFGHHLDDAIETFLMNSFFSGRLEGMDAKVSIFDGRLSIIRPLFLCPEELIIKIASLWKIPKQVYNCPAEPHSSRQVMKDLVADFKSKNQNVYGNLAKVVCEMTNSANKTSEYQI